MKYTIPQKKLFDSIYKLIDSEFLEDNLDWEYAYDPDFNESYDPNIVEFFGERYRSGNENDKYFQYIKKEYYESLGDYGNELKDKWLENSPLLELFSTSVFNKWNSLFGKLWYPVFEEWFNKNYPEFPVKTFYYNNIK